jgi:chitin elicitor receptor kinase 1
VSAGASLYIPVNCSCGNPGVDSRYGLFLTYPVVTGMGGNLSGIASDFNASTDVVKKFNPSVVWDNSQPTQYAFIPVTGANFLPYSHKCMCHHTFLCRHYASATAFG